MSGRVGVLAVAGILAVSTAAVGQTAAATDNAAGTQTPAAAPAAGTSTKKPKKVKTRKEDKVVQSSDTKKALRKEKKTDPLVGKDANLPDKQLFDKAQAAIKAGHYDVARVELQTLLNTYSDSQYTMQAKLGIGDSWFKEGGTAALDQAESEYKDFITFFPNSPEAAQAQLRVGDIYFREMDKPDRDYTKAEGAQENYRLMLQQFPDAPPELRKQATQKLRDVQEVLAERDAEIGAFYSSHQSWSAAIARLPDRGGALSAVERDGPGADRSGRHLAVRSPHQPQLEADTGRGQGDPGVREQQPGGGVLPAGGAGACRIAARGRREGPAG